jgi:hypothetical protein
VGKAHHLADVRGYAYEHRLVAEKKIGRRLCRGEQVHHRNGDRQDNRSHNIEIVGSRAEHALHHRSEKSKDRLRKPGEPNPIILCACGCGRGFKRYDTSGRPRLFVSGHNVTRDARGRWQAR